jgi:hypothetical protein
MLHRPFTVLTRWYNARGASAQERFYAVVLCDGKNLAEELVAAGFARPFGMRANFPDGPRSKDFIANLKRLESRAMRSRAGAWSKSELDDQVVSTDLTPDRSYPILKSDPPLTTPSEPFDQIASQTDSFSRLQRPIRLHSLTSILRRRPSLKSYQELGRHWRSELCQAAPLQRPMTLER